MYSKAPARANAMENPTIAVEKSEALLKLQQATPEQMDTSLLIHPWILNDFLEYNA